MGVKPSFFSPGGERKDAVKDLDTDQHPVENVSWLDAVDFCNKLSEREQLPPYYARESETVTVLGGSGYRFPTEAERECACRAGTTTRWSFGDDEQDLGKHAWIESNAGGKTHRVGDLPANPFGLYDLFGNVHEWCWDCGAVYSAAAICDPIGPTAGSGRVFRGGACYGCLAPGCRSASRQLGYGPSYHWGNIGFRVARTIDTKSHLEAK